MPKRYNYEIHISDVQAFKRCRWAWQHSSPIMSNLQPKDKYAPFFVGSMVHHALEYHYKFAIPTKEAIYAYVAANCTIDELKDPGIMEQADLAMGLVDHYKLWQKHDQTWLADNNFVFVAPEQSFKILLWENSRRRIWLAGTFDGVVQRLDNGLLYLWEIKTTRSLIEREKQLALDSQTDTYAGSAQEVLGQPIAGIIYTLIRKKIPDTPKVLQNGNMERKASADTTVEFYLDCVKKHHSPYFDNDAELKSYLADAYGDYLNELLKKPNNYFRRVIVNRSPAELATARWELLATAQQMVNFRTPIYRTDGYHCNYCLFRQPCIASKQGNTQQYISLIDNGYVPNKRFLEIEE